MNTLNYKKKKIFITQITILRNPRIFITQIIIFSILILLIIIKIIIFITQIILFVILIILIVLKIIIFGTQIILFLILIFLFLIKNNIYNTNNNIFNNNNNNDNCYNFFFHFSGKHQVFATPMSVLPALRFGPTSCSVTTPPCPHQTMQSIVKTLIGYNTHATVKNNAIHSKSTHNVSSQRYSKTLINFNYS